MAGKNFAFSFIINGNVNNKLINSFKQTSSVMQSISAQSVDLRNSFTQINNSFRKGTINAETYKKRMEELSFVNQGLAEKQKNFSAKQFFFASSNLQNTVSMMKQFAAPLMHAVNVSMDFEAAMAKVKAITSATDEETQKLTNTARALGEKTQFTASQAADAMSYLGMAGWKTNQIMAGMPGLLNLAAAGNIDLARTADIVSDNLTAFGLDAEKAGHIADVYAIAITSTNTNVEMLGDTMKYAAPVARAFGASMEETVALAGMMANAGIKASQAGTALRSGLLRLAGPPKMAAKALDELGLSAEDLTAEQKEATMALASLGIEAGNVDGPQKMSRILTQLRDKMKDLGEEQRLATAKAIFGQQSASGWLAVLDSAPETFDKLLSSLEESDGAAQRMADTMQKNGKGAIKRFQSATESLQISIGNIFLPTLTEAIDGMAKYTGGLSKTAGEHPYLIGSFVAVAATGGSAAVMLQGLGQAYYGLRAAMAIYKAVAVSSLGLTTKNMAATILHTGATFTNAAAIGICNAAISTGTGIMRLWAACQWAVNVAMAACPIGWVIAGVALLIGAGILLYKNWDTVKSFFITLWDNPRQAIDNFISAIQSKFGSICKWITDKWESMRDVLSHPIDAIVNYNKSLSSSPIAQNVPIAQNASGGIYGRGAFLTTFAEKSGESAIPHTPTSRNIGLLERTNEIMGNPLGVERFSGESAIPHTPTSRNIGLLERINEIMDNSLGIGRFSGDTGTQVTFAPVIHVQGDGDTAGIKQVMEDEMRRFKTMLEKVAHEQRRVAYE